MIYLIQGRRNVKNIGSGQADVVGEAKGKSIAIENIFYIEIIRVSLELCTANQLKSLANNSEGAHMIWKWCQWHFSLAKICKGHSD